MGEKALEILRERPRRISTRGSDTAKTNQLQDLPSQRRCPGMREPSRQAKVTMFTGTMIDELIGCVERAERHAREVESLQAELHNFSAAAQTDPIRRISV